MSVLSQETDTGVNSLFRMILAEQEAAATARGSRGSPRSLSTRRGGDALARSRRHVQGLDLDGDGIAAVIEAGGPDADRDGFIDDVVDANHDGLADRLLSAPLPVPGYRSR